MPIELVVFDLAGTTVKDNSDVHRILQQTLAKHDVIISFEDANAVMGLPKPVAIHELLKKKQRQPDRISRDKVHEIHREFVDSMINFYATDPSVGEKPGVTETFEKLKKSKLKVAIDTGFDRQITECILNRLGWRRHDLLDASVTSDEVARGRPYPDLILKAMELTNVRHSRSVAKVGDTASDLQEGASAGCGWVIGVTTGAFSKSDLQKEKHTHLIENVSEVLDILEIDN